MLRQLFAAAVVSATLAMMTGATAGWASSEFKDEVPRAAVAKPLPGAVSINASNASNAPKLNSSVTQFEKFGFRCLSNGKTPIHALITEVASDSAAYSKGLQSGDGIVALKASANAYVITVDREGKFYSVTLSNSDLESGTALNAGTATMAAALQTSAKVAFFMAV
jgi:predicted metalloprotease with PDZ domain